MNRKIALGTYRISDRNPSHIEAIKTAVESGVRLIDTSTNYMDGGAEQAIAIALNQLDDDLTCKVEIVSKFGYIQGSQMQRIKEGEHFEDLVEFAPHVFHCIHPDFLNDQLKLSLSRLHVTSIGCYLIHNPEYAFLDAMNRGQSREAALDLMFDRIYKAFVALEQAVQSGKIKSYGISSNSFAKASNDPEFLPYEDLMIFARNAAEEAGSEQHHFTTVQLPMNLLEQEGLKCASWAKEQGLRVLANRPLNAQKDQLMYRLAEYEEPREYFHRYNEVLEMVDSELTRPIFNLIEQLDASRHRFGWIGEYEAFYHQQILPHFRKALEPLEADAQAMLSDSLQLFLDQYAKMVAYECSKMTKTALKEAFAECHKPLQICALEFVAQQEIVDTVLVGMRQSRYVVDVMNVAE